MAKAPRADEALPAKGMFPLNTAGRVQVADKDAAMAEKAGSITPAEAATVRRKVAAKRDSGGSFRSHHEGEMSDSAYMNNRQRPRG